jgi:hypothetical protein
MLDRVALAEFTFAQYVHGQLKCGGGGVGEI